MRNRKKPQKSSKSRKSEAAKAVVLARSASGASNSQIAREMGIDRETVSKILSEPEIAAVIQQGKNEVVQMVPKATAVFNRALNKDDTRVATSVLTGVGVLKSESNRDSSRISLSITLDPRPRAVEVPTSQGRAETLIIQGPQPEKAQQEAPEGTALPEEIHEPFEEPEAGERRRADFAAARRDIARAGDRPSLPAWARR